VRKKDAFLKIYRTVKFLPVALYGISVSISVSVLCDGKADATPHILLSSDTQQEMRVYVCVIKDSWGKPWGEAS